MALRLHSLESRIASLDKDLASLRAEASAPIATAIERWSTDAAALRFHLRKDGGKHPPLMAILGGTGTGKSTLVNRLLEANVSATSFRRTFTAGALAIAGDAANLPAGWLGVEQRVAAKNELPARGQADALMVATSAQPLAAAMT